MEKIKLNSGIKVYSIENEEGIEVAKLRLDTNDSSTMSRFLDLIDRANALSDEVKARLEELNLDKEKLTKEEAKKALDIHNEACSKMAEETDYLFGRNFTKQLFSEHYEVNENFVPDLALFTEFFSAIIPIVKKVYGAKANKYTTKKGK